LLFAALCGCATTLSEAVPRGSSTSVWRSFDALWYRRESGQILSGVTRVRATVSPNRERRVSVGVFEEHAGSVGIQWRTSVWIASFLAAQLLGKQLTDHRFSISVGGTIDGPSAGALMAVGFLAAMTGEAMHEKTTLTGALAPDGTLMPIAGIPAKLAAAQRGGKTVVGIPAGQSVVFQADTPVDVTALGRSLGVRVVEVPDLYAAYALLTGKTLARPLPVPAAQMELSPPLLRSLAARVTTLLEKARAAHHASQGNPLHTTLSAAARRAREIATAHLFRGEVEAAYLRAADAAAVATALDETERRKDRAQRTKALQDMTGRIGEIEIDLTEASLRNRAPLALLASYGAITRARACLDVARFFLTLASESALPGQAELRRLDAQAKALVGALYLAYAEITGELARDVVHGTGEMGVHLTLDRDALRQTTRSLVSAATGNVDYLEALLLSDLSGDGSIEQTRVALAQFEPMYLTAFQLARRAIVLRPSAAPSLFSSLIRLAAAANAYVDASVVIAKFYSLGASPRPPNALRPRPLTALEALLRRAELGARETAALVRSKLGVIPTDAKI
jgi:predicted S18 family serine protease